MLIYVPNITYMCLYVVMTNYIRDMSPFGSPHQISSDENPVLFKMVQDNYVPKPTIVVGGLVADVVKGDVWGTVIKKVVYTGRKKGTFVTIQGVNGRKRVRSLQNCVGVHPKNAFVRHHSTKIWYKIMRNQSDQSSIMSAVLVDEGAEGQIF